jgi:hypothetical protein
MKVLICGGRDMDRIDAWNWLERNLYAEIADATGVYSPTIDRVIHGGARGADDGADDWARSEHVPVVACPADWKKHGKAAGPIRNRMMLEVHRPDVVVALPGGRGTANMIMLAEGAGVPVVRVEAI